MLKIKKIILFILDSIKRLLFLNNLNKNELNGFITPLTKFRLFPNTRVTVPYSLGRTVRGVSFDKNLKFDPAGRLCNDISIGLDDKKIANNLSTVLYEQKNMSAADILNLTNNKNLQKYPAWSAVMPWEKITIEEMFESYPETFYKNRHSRGLIFENRERKSIIKMMYSSRFIENRVSQMKELYESIKSNGVIKDSNLPKVNILVKDNEWRWFMGDGGNHRSYILSYLNHDFFAARISLIINKNEVIKWHNVKNGTYSVDEANEIFDCYFEATKVFRGMV
jgi:hypothetical protein|tara:strand:- start:869 stop:1708 length:840 start_codon:yes stop_codon:yes gene_type:complete